jgi:hypothetical protein
MEEKIAFLHQDSTRNRLTLREQIKIPFQPKPPAGNKKAEPLSPAS